MGMDFEGTEGTILKVLAWIVFSVLFVRWYFWITDKKLRPKEEVPLEITEKESGTVVDED